MGTNYYARKDACEHCGRADRIHVGKTSAGWVPIFRVYKKEYDDEAATAITEEQYVALPEMQTWEDWKAYLLSGGVEVESEYGDRYAAEQFVDLMEARMAGGRVERDSRCSLVLACAAGTYNVSDSYFS